MTISKESFLELRAKVISKLSPKSINILEATQKPSDPQIIQNTDEDQKRANLVIQQFIQNHPNAGDFLAKLQSRIKDKGLNS